MRIITLNVNGIRAAARKGFFDWLPRQEADLVCLQETRAQPDQRRDPMFTPSGYHVYYLDAERKGYSGVAIYSRMKPDRVIEGLGWKDFDREGRALRVDLGRLSVISLYLPSGSSGDVRQDFKFDVIQRMKSLLTQFASDGREYLVCGDINIAHKEIDLKNWRSNQKNSGFLPAERTWLDWLFDEAGFVDTFRRLDSSPEQYTWWSNRGQSWVKNVGWRIDYQIATPTLAKRSRRTSIYKDERFSDHAPLTIDYDVSSRWLRARLAKPGIRKVN
jgi:exodeoxyribonuclease-3